MHVFLVIIIMSANKLLQISSEAVDKLCLHSVVAVVVISFETGC